MARMAAAVLCMALAACGARSREDFAGARSDDGPGFHWNRRPSLESTLEPGMPYGQFRRELLSRGWEPMADAGCRANLVGSAPDEQCAPADDMCRVCEDLPELSVFASDGLAVVWFRHADDGHELQASALGEIADRDRVDSGSRFRLVAWEIADDPAKEVEQGEER